MKIKFSLRNDSITPALKAKLRAAQNPRKALEAMGAAVVGLADRAFTEAALRPTAWPALKASTIKKKTKAGHGTKPLRSTGHLAHSPRIFKVTNRNVTVGSDRATPRGGHSLAAIHQLGTKDGKIPARPFFPFDKRGRPTPRAKKNVAAAAKLALDPVIKRK